MPHWMSVALRSLTAYLAHLVPKTSSFLEAFRTKSLLLHPDKNAEERLGLELFEVCQSLTGDKKFESLCYNVNPL